MVKNKIDLRDMNDIYLDTSHMIQSRYALFFLSRVVSCASLDAI